MSKLDQNFDNVPEIHLLPDDTEVELVIKSAEKTEKKTKPGEFQYHIVAEPKDDPFAEDIHHYVGIPNPEKADTSPKEYGREVARLRMFCDCFGIPMDDIDEDYMPGLTGWVLVGIQEADGQYSAKNIIKKFLNT